MDPDSKIFRQSKEKINLFRLRGNRAALSAQSDLEKSEVTSNCRSETFLYLCINISLYLSAHPTVGQKPFSIYVYIYLFIYLLIQL